MTAGAEEQPPRSAREIFDEAISLPPTERLTFVRKACGEDVLLAAEVVELLRAEAKANTEQLRRAARGETDASSAEAPRVEAEPASEPDPEPVPEQIGPYRILGTLGSGGMGDVYLAERRQPMRQRVALKVMKPGLDSRAFLARFEAERQAMAMMEHSCIAKIYDSGMTESGRPFLAMEYVKGVPITDYCDQTKLSIQQRLELFVLICSAIQHAHSKGVMHRDLKPTNILVSEQDGQPTPKVIDFGLAKAVDHRLVEATVFTEQGQIIGTPEYMSPEQAGVGGLDIDTRTDVFSLGVLLYELLTGTLPVTREELLRHGWFEMQRFLREGELQKPSTKVTTLGDGAAAFAKARQVPLNDLGRKLRGELDWIVMRALEKDRNRRYATAHELGADLLRHLANEPINARPPSAGYLLSKVLRKYRGLVTAAAAVVVALGVGLGVALWQRGEAIAAEGRAVEQAKRADAARKEAVEARGETEVALGKHRRLSDRIRLLAVREQADVLAEDPDNLGRFEELIEEMDQWIARLPEYRTARDRVLSSAEVVDGERRFAAPIDGYEYEGLVDLVAGIEELQQEGGLYERMQDSLTWVRQMERETVEDEVAAEAWRQAIREIRDDPAFDRLITRQLGLIPLGRSADSQLQEFWMPRTGDRPEKDGKGGWLMTPSTGIVLVLVPGGTFEMGSRQGEMAQRNEAPHHDVTVGPFFISKYELTQGQWSLPQLGAENPSRYQNAKSGHYPVERVSWLEADRRLRRLGLTLPTEAQWEYACRAGTKTEWYFGDDKEGLIREDTGQGRFNAASGPIPDARFQPEFDDGCPVHTFVGRFEPNAFGLHDMHGNIGEMTRGFAATTYDGVQHRPGDGLILGGRDDEGTGGSSYVQRGGSYSFRVEVARCASRTFVAKEGRYNNIGLRVVRALDD